MSICYSGMESKVQSGKISIKISAKHPLIKLAQSLPWGELADLVIEDLKKTPAGKWWLGRKLKLRIHIGMYLLQQLFNKTDRQTEYDVRDNAAYQLFCGYGIVERWHVPDHTKIEKFRSRLSRETQKKLANAMAVQGVRLGFGELGDLDIDSTIQEANMAYPADSCLLKKLGAMCQKTAGYLNKTKDKIQEKIEVNLKKINSAARSYFFLPKNTQKAVKDEKLGVLLEVVKEEGQLIIEICEKLKEEEIKKMPWNIGRTVRQIKSLARQYLIDVGTFLREGSIVVSKRLSFHLKEVSCFGKGKPGKKYQFGRAFQLGRIKGNFMIVEQCGSTQMPDKTSLEGLITEHENLFGVGNIVSMATDKGYYSAANERTMYKKGVKEIGIQRPANIKRKRITVMSKEREEELINRRSGIEPLIGHIKQGGQLGRSRMKSDDGMECSGYSAVLGFNMRQLIRYQKEKVMREAA